MTQPALLCRARVSAAHALPVVIAIAGAVSTISCSTTMESGYKPRALNSSPEVRRSYYASPFSPEADATAHQHDTDTKARRPGY